MAITQREYKDQLIQLVVAIVKRRGIDIETDHKFRKAAAAVVARRLAKQALDIELEVAKDK